MSTAAQALAALAEIDATVAVAESVTGGMVCAALTDEGGSSAGFVGGVVAYTVGVKQRLLGVDMDLLDNDGPVDPDVARQMAEGVTRACGATMGVATTGVAGPTWHGGEPPGTAFIGWSTASGRGAIEVDAPGDRDEVRRIVTDLALQVVTQCARNGTAGSSGLTGPAKCTDRE